MTAKVAFWPLKQAICLVLVSSFNTGRSGCKEGRIKITFWV